MSGVKHDGGKARWDLLPIRAASAIVDVLTFGAKKYGPNNWRLVPDHNARYYAAAMRHLTAWWIGETHDKESGLHHLAHAGCCILFLLEPTRDAAESWEGLEAIAHPVIDLDQRIKDGNELVHVLRAAMHDAENELRKLQEAKVSGLRAPGSR